ncbi:hypothetical protein SLOPH_927, partial [Spraguea lophii 42_110]
MAKLTFLGFFGDCKLFKLKKNSNFIKISNFKNAGYIYYYNIILNNPERITTIPKNISEETRKEEEISKSEIISKKERNGEIKSEPETSSEEEKKIGETTKNNTEIANTMIILNISTSNILVICIYLLNKVSFILAFYLFFFIHLFLFIYSK